MAVLWGEDPPPTDTASLHNHVARLRRGLGDTGGTRPRTMARGLELHVDEGELDRDMFEGQVRRTQETHHRGDWEVAERAAGAATSRTTWSVTSPVNSPHDRRHGPCTAAPSNGPCARTSSASGDAPRPCGPTRA
uniref:AfsR/SARP family transcriptional regulator n=1 Tax=Streptomyces europaeiscabiei TaxID=146819 RepID=UPI0013C505B1